MGKDINKFTTRYEKKSHTFFLFFFFVLKLPSSFKSILLRIVLLNLLDMTMLHFLISFIDMNLIVSLLTHHFSELKISHLVLLFLSFDHFC